MKLSLHDHEGDKCLTIEVGINAVTVAYEKYTLRELGQILKQTAEFFADNPRRVPVGQK